MADRISEKIMRKIEALNGATDTENQDAQDALPAMTTAIQIHGGKPSNTPKTRKLKMNIKKANGKKTKKKII